MFVSGIDNSSIPDQVCPALVRLQAFLLRIVPDPVGTCIYLLITFNYNVVKFATYMSVDLGYLLLYTLAILLFFNKKSTLIRQLSKQLVRGGGWYSDYRIRG